MSEPDNEMKSSARAALLRSMGDGEWRDGKILRDICGGGHHYSARIGELRELGYRIEKRKTSPGKFDEYRLRPGMNSPALSTNVRVLLSYSLLESFFARDLAARDALKLLLVDARDRAQVKYDEAKAHQEKLAQVEGDFFESLQRLEEEEEEAT